VAITPAAGVVQPVGAMVLGVLASLICYGTILLKNRMGFDDSLDVFGIHGMGGIVGAIFLTFFIRASWMADAAEKAGGSWSVAQQLGVQAIAVGVTLVFAAITTLLLVVLVEKTVGFRLKETDEMSGLDHSMHSEHGYGLINLN
jgi:Amt family ammonium transporter